MFWMKLLQEGLEEGCHQTSPTPATNVRLWRRGPDGSEASANLRLRPEGRELTSSQASTRRGEAVGSGVRPPLLFSPLAKKEARPGGRAWRPQGG